MVQKISFALCYDLQSEIHSLERTRESMAKELVNLSNSNDELLEQVQELPILREQYKVNFALALFYKCLQ